MTHPTTSRAEQRIAALAAITAEHGPGCHIHDDARDLLILQCGGDVAAAARVIATARAELWRDPTNPAENAMTADDDALYRDEQGH
ncbi:hypothetical protein AB0392_48875 [Nonomuraea angiospora]|uniref:hypothetical protein n=1 Tax=Nonomuraea angiospora TaxID=46172 RepID=UPI00344D4D43